MMKRLPLFTVSVLLSAAPILPQSPSLTIAIGKLPEQSLPVKIVTAHVECSQFRYQLKADLEYEDGAKVVFSDLLLVLFREGNVISAEGWREFTPDHAVTRDVSRMDFKPGDRAVLIVIATGKDTQIYALARNDISLSIREFAAGRLAQPIPANVSKNENGANGLIRCSGYCALCEAIKSEAESDCGTGGVLASSAQCFKNSYLYECKAGRKRSPSSMP